MFFFGFFLLAGPSQDVFLLPHIPYEGKGGGSILLVHYSMIVLKPAMVCFPSLLFSLEITLLLLLLFLESGSAISSIYLRIIIVYLSNAEKPT